MMPRGKEPVVEKLCYALWDTGAAPIARVREALLGELGRELRSLTRGELTVHVADVEPGPGQIARASTPWPPLAALVSLWLDSLDARAPVEERLRAAAPEIAGYLVTESVPLDWQERSWRDGERSPGMTTVAMFEKPARLGDEEFFARWHGSHTPLSLKIHPIRRYVRNAVARRLTPGAPEFRGIVPEAFDDLDHFLDPRKMYGSRENFELMMADQQAFLDLARVHWTATGEYILRSR
jgi:hypothetical protein